MGVTRRVPENSYSLYAAFLDLRNVPVLVVGGGAVAARKITGLLASGARVTAIAPEFDSQFDPLLQAQKPARASSSPEPRTPVSGRCRLVRRKFRDSDLNKHRIVYALTNDLKLNRHVAALAGKQGILVNVASPPDAGNMHVPAGFRRGRLQIAISSGGASAALAKSLREYLERIVGPEWGQLAGMLEARRARLLAEINNPEKRACLLHVLGSPRWVRMIKKRGLKQTALAMDAVIAATKRLNGIV